MSVVKARRLTVPAELVADMREVFMRPSDSNAEFDKTALLLLSGCVGEYWLNSTPKGIFMGEYQRRVRAFMREGYSINEAHNKARVAYKQERG